MIVKNNVRQDTQSFLKIYKNGRKDKLNRMYCSCLLYTSSDVFHCVGVADGVGGNAGGRIASKYVAHEISQADFPSMTQQEL